MKEIWELCRKLNNPVRMQLLAEIYAPKPTPGLNVGIAIDDSGMKQSTASEHFSALASLGLIRRCRSGRFVNYYPDISNDFPRIAEIARMIRERVMTDPNDLGFTSVFPAMMNAFRSHAVAYIATTSGVTLLALAEKYDKEMRLISRDLKPAAECGLISISAEGSSGIYSYTPPADPIARRIVELSTPIHLSR